MPKPIVDFPVFDADNHMYETTDAFTKFLPPEYSGLDQVRRGQRSHQDRRAQRDLGLHPEPDVQRRRTARGVGGALQARQPGGEDPPRADGRADPLARGVLLARAAPRAHGRARPRPCPHVADAGQPARGAPGRRPHRHAHRRARAERVDARALDLQLRGPHLRVPGHHAAHRRQGDRGARVGGRAGGQAHFDQAGTGSRLPRLPVVRTARVRSLLAAGDRA